MKIFISWSGERSRIIAEGLNEWLPKVIQAVKPFYSPEIEKGTKGIEEINKTLEGTSFGIICLTPDNIESTWIHYEAGALSKIEGARIWTLLHNLKHSDIVQPLAQFQHTLAKKTDVYKLLDSINAKLPEPLDKSVLRDSFERWWSDFEETLEKAEKVVKNDNRDDINIRSDREILNEVLELLRNQKRQSDMFDGSLENFLKNQTKKARHTSTVYPTLDALRKNAEYIGVKFTISVNNELKAKYEKIIKDFLSKVSSERNFPTITNTKEGIDVQIIFESTFDYLVLGELTQAVIERFGKILTDLNPILLEDWI